MRIYTFNTYVHSVSMFISCLIIFFFLFFLCFVFFFQAEDGIRDLVRSRGLGDVYKRQSLVIRQNIYPKQRIVTSLANYLSGNCFLLCHQSTTEHQQEHKQALNFSHNSSFYFLKFLFSTINLSVIVGLYHPPVFL